MANVVEIVIKGNDQSSQVMEKAAASTKRLSNDMKALGGTVNQLGNAFSVFGGTQMALALNSIEAAIATSSSLTGNLAKSKLGIVALGSAAVVAATQIGDFLRQWVPFFNDDILVKRADDLNKKVGEVLEKRLALRDADAARDKEFSRSIDSQIAAVRLLKGEEADKNAVIFQLEQLRTETLEKNAQDRQDKEIASFEASFARWEQYGNQIIEKLQELGNAELAQLQAVDLAFDKRGADLLEFYSNQIISDEQFFLMEGALFEVHQKEMTKVEKDQSDKRMAILDAEKKKRLQSLSTYMSSSASIFGSLATLIETTGKKNFELAQGFRYAEAVVNTAAGIARALADYQWPLSIVVGAAVAAAGAAQIATIAAAKPPQAHGGASYIPSESTYLLNKGERVLSPRQNEDLTSFMRSGGGGGTIMIDGRRLGEELHNMSRDGRLKIDGRAIV